MLLTCAIIIGNNANAPAMLEASWRTLNRSLYRSERPMSDSTISLKRCSICGLEFPATTEFFYRNHNGLRADCKNCRRAYDKRRYDRVRDHRLLQMRQWYAENRDYKLEQSRLWHEANKEYRRLYKKEWYATHRNYALEYMRNYRVLNLDEVRARNRDWHYQNLHRSRKSHQEWYKANPERRRVYSARRRSRIKASGEQFNAIDVLVQFKSQKGLCWWCEKPLDPDNYHIDHRVPISKGGGNSAGQIVISCPTCNLSKKDKMPWEWIGRLL